MNPEVNRRITKICEFMEIEQFVKEDKGIEVVSR